MNNNMNLFVNRFRQISKLIVFCSYSGRRSNKLVNQRREEHVAELHSLLMNVVTFSAVAFQ